MYIKIIQNEHVIMQTFKLYHPDTKHNIAVADNLHMYSEEYIVHVIEKQLIRASWDIALQYEAIGSEGDKIIYQDGKIQISKSSL